MRNAYPGSGKPRLVMNVAMALVFFSLGMLFLCTTAFIDRYPRPTRYCIGGLLVLWSCFRGYTTYIALKQIRREEQEEDEIPSETNFDIQEHSEPPTTPDVSDTTNKDL